MGDEASRNAVEVAERFADGRASRIELISAAASAAVIAEHACETVKVAGDVWSPAWISAQAALAARFASILEDDGEVINATDVANNTIWHSNVVAGQTGVKPPLILLRDVIGNPFHPVVGDLTWWAWNGGTVPMIAQAIYDEQAFDRMPVLADALEDAGCANAEILRHCREPGEHVRGCWVVDLLLGKE
jgi:hypothetical protein